MENIVKKLIKLNKTISTMESCTGGYIASCITNIDGSSEVFSFAAVTYSNEFKIKMGVSGEAIEKYSVYSIEVAHEMSKNISMYTNSDYGVGVTGKINRSDINNPYGEDNLVYLSIYIKEKNEFVDRVIVMEETDRLSNKNKILDELINCLHEVI